MTMWRSTGAGTANAVAGAIIGRAIAAGQLTLESLSEKDGFDAFDAIRDHVMENIEEFLSQDDEAVGSGSSKGSKSRSKKTGGGRKGKGKKAKTPKTLEEALELELTFGAFEGESLATILEVDAADADSEYDYGDGERDGRDYISWLADSAKDKAVKKAAQLVADENDIEYGE